MTDTDERTELLRRLGWSEDLIAACLSAPEGTYVDAPEIPALVAAEVTTSSIIVERVEQNTWVTGQRRHR